MDFKKLATAKNMMGPSVSDEYKDITAVIYENGIGSQTNSYTDLLKDGNIDVLDIAKPLFNILGYVLGSLDAYDQHTQSHTEIISAVLDTINSNIIISFKCDNDIESVAKRFDYCCTAIVTSETLDHNGYCNFWVPVNKLVNGYIIAHLYIWVDTNE